MASAPAKPATKPAAKPTSTKVTKAVTPPVLATRVRCSDPECKHTGDSGWLRGLFILSAAEPKKPEKEGEKPPPPKYGLWVSDQLGAISPIAEEKPPEQQAGGEGGPPDKPPAEGPAAAADTEGTHKHFAGVPYLFYLVLHPEIQRAKDILKVANGGEALDKLGEPLRLVPALQEVAGAKKGSTTKALVFDIPTASYKFTDAAKGRVFHPEGSARYAGLNIFENMPNRNCARVKKQIERLQYHLGALRYIVGQPEAPYRPDATAGTIDDPKGVKRLRANVGRFDTGPSLYGYGLLYGAVLAFMRHAASKKCFKLGDDAKASLARLIDENGEPTAVAKRGDEAVPADGGKHRSLSLDFLAGAEGDTGSKFDGADCTLTDFSDADWATLEKWDKGGSKGPQPVPFPAPVVGRQTGDEIGDWLAKGYRKPGHILVAIEQTHAPWFTWLREDCAAKFLEWRRLLAELGYAPDLKRKDKGEGRLAAGHTFRDIRWETRSAEVGKSPTSIHKTGLAADLLMNSDYDTPHTQFPGVVHQLDTLRDRIAWQLFVPTTLTKEQVEAKAAALGIPTKDLWAGTVTNFSYDRYNPKGGKSNDPKPGSFINVTTIGRHLGLERIFAWASGWQASVQSVKVDSTKALAQVAAAMNTLVKDGQGKEDVLIESPSRKASITGTVADLDPAFYDGWALLLGRWNASPDVEIANAPGLPNLLHEEFQGKSFIIDDGRVVTQGSDLIQFRVSDRVIRPYPGPVNLSAGDTISVTKGGSVKPREWWHFQDNTQVVEGGDSMASSAKGRKYGTVLGEIGYPPEALFKMGYSVNHKRKGGSTVNVITQMGSEFTPQPYAK